MNLSSDKRQNPNPQDPSSSSLGAQGRRKEATESLLANHEHESPTNTDRIMEEICEWENLKEAMWRVKANLCPRPCRNQRELPGAATDIQQPGSRCDAEPPKKLLRILLY